MRGDVVGPNATTPVVRATGQDLTVATGVRRGVVGLDSTAIVVSSLVARRTSTAKLGPGIVDCSPAAAVMSPPGLDLASTTGMRRYIVGLSSATFSVWSPFSKRVVATKV